MKKTNKLYDYITIKNAFFSEVGIGISVNTLLLLFYIFSFLLQHKFKPTDLIICLLTLVHLGMMTVLGYIATNVFVSQNFWNDINCISIIYFHRIFRGFSLCITCLLSVLQAIILSPRTSCLAKFKHQSPHHILCSLVSLWVFYMSLSAHLSFPSTAIPNVTSHGLVFTNESYNIVQISYFLRNLFSVLGVFRDVFLIGLMTLSNGYMVALLCRHKKNFQKLHSSRLSPKASPVERATWTILLFTSFFVFMYCLDSFISSLRTMWKDGPVYLYIQMLVANCYATTSPLLLICTEKRIINFFKCLLLKIVLI